MTLRLSLCLLILVPALARAQEDPDVQAARRHFVHGQQLYEQEKYDEAEREFTTAKELKPIPAFDYNIARCLDRLERWGEAADAYERYLAAEPNTPGAVDIQQRIVVLRARSKSETRPTPPAAEKPKPEAIVVAPTVSTTAVVGVAPPHARRPVYQRAWFWTVMGAGVAAVAVGVALGLTLDHAGDGSHAIMDVHF